MRCRMTGAVAGGVAMMAIGALGGCGDLFHETSDIRNACERDASTAGCPGVTPGGSSSDGSGGSSDVDAGDGAPREYDFCAMASPTALATAQNACAWLGACESPVGNNRFADCMRHAILAYDCRANPNRPVRSNARAFWGCMQGATDCASVDRCALPSGRRCVNGTWLPSCVPPAQGDAIADASGVADAGGGFDFGPASISRATCANGLPEGDEAENCAAWGQTCVESDGGARCGSAPGGGACIASLCVGGALTDCDDAGRSIGVDCANYGAQTCTASGAGAACVAQGGAICPSGPEVVCLGEIATGCPSGEIEAVDCTLLVPRSDGGSAMASSAAAPGANPMSGGSRACHASGAGSPKPWDVSRACFLDQGCTTADACSGATLTSCVGGVTYSFDCGASPFGGCQVVLTSDADGARARCVVR